MKTPPPQSVDFTDTMPPKSKKTITIQHGQNSLDVFLKRPTNPIQHTDTTVQAVLPSHIRPTTGPLFDTQTPKETDDAQVQAFRASLTPNERVAHTLAAELLGTSYDIRRTHGFVRWLKSSSADR